MKNKWSLVIHEATQTTVSIWVGTLFSDCRKYTNCVVKLLDDSETLVTSEIIHISHWHQPFNKLPNRFYKLIKFENLDVNSQYYVEFVRLAEPVGGIQLNEKVLSRGQFSTLPNQLSTEKPFVVALGSCFYSEADNGLTSKAYSQLYFNGNEEYKPDIKLLTGDQVYLDIGLDSLSPISKDIRTRIADDYAHTWQMQRKMFRNGATWFLADDHEYWNNFPQTSSSNPYLWMITASTKAKNIWREAAKCGVENVQQIRRVRTFTLGDDLSFCLVDCRSSRQQGSNPQNFIPKKDFDAVIQWVENLVSPGVLVLPQPLLVNQGGLEDYNLANYQRQYAKLIHTLSQSEHDIVCMSGDVHYGRVASVPIGNKGTMLYEIISSPMSNLTGLDGKFAASSPEKVCDFPTIDIKGLLPQKVLYQKNWAVSTECVSKWYLPDYNKTKEHFMTVSFKKTKDDNTEMNIQAWKIRDVDSSGFPEKEFSQPIRFILKSRVT